ncbi:hypothetical protein B0H10DRAFT_2174251 [Mycena sp. CBHHK59/15]|nr:hypothetical protein B0H10DRAFT_2174251 [Mycena sp. CBHHK59/15]
MVLPMLNLPNLKEEEMPLHHRCRHRVFGYLLEIASIHSSPTIFQSFPDYLATNVSQEHVIPRDEAPWKTFQTRLDFEVAEFCELAMLNTEMTEILIALIQCCGHNIKNFTLTSHAELNKLWALASHKCTEFVEDSITVQYKGENQTFKTYSHPLWDWVLSLVQDPQLSSCFPWTADAFWAAQSALPNHPAAKPLCLILYADTSKLSTFGTAKGYAVVARVANVIVPIRNSTQFGGGQVVGHQPVVKDDPKENSKPAFTNFKNVVWHAAFWKLLGSLVHHSKTGSWTMCGDEILRWLWPLVLILASDYEEACVMALIRGLQALYPCPIFDLSTKHLLHTAEDSQQKLEEARACQTAAECEEILKANSLRDVDNIFWKIGNTDPHRALSFDCLHAYHGGLWGDHLFSQIKLRVTDKGHESIVKIDKQMAAMPCWRGLNYFDNDIAKLMLFATHNVLVDKPGVLLLQYTIAAGQHELLVFDLLMKEYVKACVGTDYEDKNWNFPKMHSHQHVFDDIENKGASRNFGTKINESMHGPIRQTYHKLTNFKDVTPQLIKHDHRRAVALFIREQLDALDGPEDSLCPADLEAEVQSNISIGSKLKPIMFSALEDGIFHMQFGEFLSNFLPAFGYRLPNGNRIRFEKTDMIVPFQFLKVYYKSLGNWTSTTDYLQCNPNFHGQSRYDSALVKTTNGFIFVQLIYMFSCMVEGKSHPFALVLPLDSRTDKALRLHRVCTKPRKDAEIISAHSIVHGALLAPDFDSADEFFVVDIADTDISL